MSQPTSPHAEAQLEKARRLAGLLRSWGFTAQDAARFDDADWEALCRADKALHRASRSWRSEIPSQATRLMTLGEMVE